MSNILDVTNRIKKKNTLLDFKEDKVPDIEKYLSEDNQLLRDTINKIELEIKNYKNKTSFINYDEEMK